jgi:hypothetical protein
MQRTTKTPSIRRGARLGGGAMKPLNEDKVLALFPDAARSGENWSARCPGHDDDRPSLSIGFGKEGKVLVHCHAGCTNGDIAFALGLKSEATLYARLAAAEDEQELFRHPTADYNYHDAAGHWVYTVTRFDRGGKKTYRPWVPNEDGGVDRWGLRGVTRVPYRRPSLQQQPLVCVAEGEKCADALHKLGIVATTTVGGAKGWRSKHAYGLQLLQAGVRDVVIFPDNDEPGRAYAETAAADCFSEGLKVRVVELPGLETGEDVYDYLSKGGTKEALLALIRETPLWTPATWGAGRVSDFDRQLLGLYDEVDMIALLNTRHYTIKLGNQMVVADERPGQPLSFFSYPQFMNRYRPHIVIIDDFTRVSLGKLYLNSLLHRHFDGRLVCKPPGVSEPAGPDDRNLWRGLAVEPKPGDWSRLQHHILQNVCGGNATHYEYLFNWLALLVQLPGRLPGTAICLRGKMGAGKTAFVKFVERIFHPESVATVTKPDLIVGRFNSILSEKVLMFADEAFFAGDPTSRGRLQALITDRTNVIERKGFEPVVEDNCVHLIIASNEDWIIGVNENDRRFLVLDVGDEHIQDLPYFDAIRHQQDDSGGTAAMLHDLLARDLTAFNPMTLPWTAAKQDQVTRSRKGFEEWWHHVLTEATSDDWQNIRPKRALHQAYLHYADAINDRHPQGPELLSKFFVKYYGAGVIGRRRIGQKQTHVYLLPALAEARQRFDAREPWPKDPRETAMTIAIRRQRSPG